MSDRQRSNGDPTSDRDAGVSIIELIVAMFLLAILMTIVMKGFTAFSTNFTEERAAADSSRVAATGMNELTRVIRAGTELAQQGVVLDRPVFSEIKPNGMTLAAYFDTNSLDPAPVKIRFSINASGELVETRWKGKRLANGDWTFEPTEYYTKTVARKIVPPASGKPLFSYVIADGADAGVDDDILVLSAAGSTDASVLRSVKAVQVTMNVQADPTARANPVQLRNRVGIPNLGVSRVGL